MLALATSKSVPINPQFMAQFGASPWQGGFHGGCGCDPIGGCRCGSTLHGGHGGSSHSGMGRSSISYTGFRGLNQGGVSLDQIISNVANWFSGYAQSQLPASASVPPQYGSAGAISTQIQALLPWAIGGYLLFKVLK